MSDEKDLIARIVRCGLKVNNILGTGFDKEIYANALAVELKDSRLQAEVKKEYDIKYKGQVVGKFTPGLVVENEVAVALVVDRDLDNILETKIRNYVRFIDFKKGVILCFGDKFEFKRIELETSN
ncbi:MAG: GxxExxY protein [Vulcanimicrobiota bacterium]